MKTSKLLLMLAIVLGGGTAYAASASAPHQHEANARMVHEGSGVIKEVNTSEGKVKIAHQPIPALKWPGMTMWFDLRGKLPPGIEIGDSVRFELQQDKDKWVITRIEHKK